MQTIKNLIQRHGGMEPLINGELLLIKNPGKMDLKVEFAGRVKEIGTQIMVSQFDALCGEMICSPEMLFLLTPSGEWQSLTYRDDVEPIVKTHVYEEFRSLRDCKIDRDMQRRLNRLARDWDEQLKKDGYLAAPVDIQYIPFFEGMSLAGL